MGQGMGLNRPTVAVLAHYDAMGLAPVSARTAQLTHNQTRTCTCVQWKNKELCSSDPLPSTMFDPYILYMTWPYQCSSRSMLFRCTQCKKKEFVLFCCRV